MIISPCGNFISDCLGSSLSFFDGCKVLNIFNFLNLLSMTQLKPNEFKPPFRCQPVKPPKTKATGRKHEQKKTSTCKNSTWFTNIYIFNPNFFHWKTSKTNPFSSKPFFPTPGPTRLTTDRPTPFSPPAPHCSPRLRTLPPTGINQRTTAAGPTGWLPQGPPTTETPSCTCHHRPPRSLGFWQGKKNMVLFQTNYIFF